MDARNLPDLLVLIEVVRAGSITRAAQRPHTVQSNVTARIKKLEQVAGAPLLQRHARGVQPTPAGEAALALALRMDAVFDDLHFTFGKQSAARIVPLRIGAIETVLASHLPAMVAGFLREHPHVDVSVRTGSSAALLKDLKEGKLDAVFVSRVPESPAFRHRLAIRDELVVIASADSETKMKPWQMKGPPLKILVQRLGCSYTERLLAFLAQRSHRPYRLLELGTLEGILGFVATGMGIAAIPRAFVGAAAAQRGIHLHELPQSVRHLQTHLVIHGGGEASFATETFFNWTGRNGSTSAASAIPSPK